MECSASYGLKVLLRVFVKPVSQYIIQFQLHSRAPEFHNILLKGSEQKKKKNFTQSTSSAVCASTPDLVFAVLIEEASLQYQGAGQLRTTRAQELPLELLFTPTCPFLQGLMGNISVDRAPSFPDFPHHRFVSRTQRGILRTQVCEIQTRETRVRRKMPETPRRATQRPTGPGSELIGVALVPTVTPVHRGAKSIQRRKKKQLELSVVQSCPLPEVNFAHSGSVLFLNRRRLEPGES